MQNLRELNGERTFAVKLSDTLINRLRVESVRSGRNIRTIVAAALDNALPDHEIVVTRKPSRTKQESV